MAPELHLYYSSGETDLNVLGAISILSLIKVGEPNFPTITECGEAYCFEILDTVNTNWRLCAKSWKRAVKWTCAIKKSLGIEDATCDDSKI